MARISPARMLNEQTRQWSPLGVCYDGGYLTRVGGYSAGDLPDGYNRALVDDLGVEIGAEFRNNLYAIERAARGQEAASMDTRADDLFKQASALWAEATKARLGEDYKTRVEIERDIRI